MTAARDDASSSPTSLMQPLTAADADITVSPAPARESGIHGVNRLVAVVRNGRRFMLKCLRPELEGIPQYEALLRKEYDLTMPLDHPGIVRVVDFTAIPGVGRGILMEWIDGPTLGAWLATEPPAAERMRIAAEIADALAYAHAAGVCHRDLKPDNIIVASRRHTARIIDFGLGDADDHLLMKMSGATARYGAPEQLAGEASDSRADVYSFGVILRELCPGAPFRSIAADCMRADPARRPTIDEVVSRIARARRSVGRRPYIIAAAVATALIASAASWLMLRPAAAPPAEERAEEAIEAAAVETADTIAEAAAPLPAPAPTAAPTSAPTASPDVTDIMSTGFTRADSLIAACAPGLLAAAGTDAHGELMSRRTDAMFALAADLENRLRTAGLDDAAVASAMQSFWYHAATAMNSSDGLR